MISTKDIDYSLISESPLDYSQYTYEDFKYSPGEFHYIEHNKILFKGVILKVTPEFLQDANAGSIDWYEIVDNIITLYNKHISVVREYKINQILGE